MKLKFKIFHKHEYKIKLNFFIHRKLTFQPRTWNYSVNVDVNYSILFKVNVNSSVITRY